MRDALACGEEVEPLDALRDMTELASLLTGWRWQVLRAAREAGASWEEIAGAAGATAEQAEAEYSDAVARRMRYSVPGFAS